MNVQDVREINLKNFIKVMIKKWKMIVGVFLIGCLLGGIGAVGTKKAYDIKTTGTNGVTADLSGARASLGKADVQYVDQMYSIYDKLVKRQGEFQKYIDSSQILNQDISATYGSRMLFIVKFQGMNNSGMMDKAISMTLVNDDFCQKVNQQLGTEYSNFDINNMIKVKTKVDEDDSNNNVSPQMEIGIKGNEKLIIVDIVVQDKQQAEVVSELVKKRMNTLCKSISKDTSKITPVFISQIEKDTVKGDVKDTLVEYTNSIKIMADTVNSLTAGLTEDQKTYFNALRSQGNVTQKSDDKVQRVEMVFSVKKLIKYVGAGGVGLTILLLFGMFIKYVFSKALHSVDELHNILGLDVLCKLEPASKKELGNYSINIAREELKYLLEEYPDEKIGLVTSSDKLEKNGILSHICKDEFKDRIVLLKARPERDSDFEALTLIKRAVVVEKVNISIVDQIQELLRYYKKKNIVIDGVIIVE